MSGESKVTTDHKAIKKWAEERKGVPATIKGTEKRGEKAGLLRIHFPEHSKEDETFEELSWDEFFDKFEKENLAFSYQEKTKDGNVSRYFKLVNR